MIPVYFGRMTSTALQWLLDDAKRQGLTLSEYEREYGVILSYGDEMPLASPAAKRIMRNEILAGHLEPEEIARASRESRDVLGTRGSTPPRQSRRRTRVA